ncbi:MAG: RluA family pseudouridine synthase [Eubacteriales bacterium]
MDKPITNPTKSNPKNELTYKVETPSELLPFLLAKMDKTPRGKVKSLLTHRCVYVDGVVTTKHNHPLAAGQTVSITRTTGAIGTNERPTLPILYEDTELIVIDKPAGLLSVSTGKEDERTAYSMLYDYMRGKSADGRVFVVHRLDKDTSGVLIFAKNEQIKTTLQDSWDTCVSERGYMAVVEGALDEKDGTITSFLAENSAHIVYVSDKGVSAVTDYKVVGENSGYSLLDIRLRTGRKNQIRVQLQQKGHPVAGDKRYGASSNPLGRLALHSHRLVLTHPVTGKEMAFEAPVPPGFRRVAKGKAK